MKKQIFSCVLAASMAASTLVVPASAAQTNVIRLKPAAASPFNNGEFEGWGTSMGWWGNRLGHSDKLAQQSAELFYSEEGLGLDIVRYNVGGGDDPTHNHVTRSDSKLPCFAVPQTNADGSFVTDENGDVVYDYNWEADHDQMNVLKEIKKANPDVHIEGYTNSPPWFMTNSGCSSGGVDAAENLDPSNYDAFAKFLGDVTEHFEEIGLKFDSYSPMNEPSTQTDYWGAFSPKQEGNHVAPGANQSGIINALSAEYDKRGIDTLVVGLDETSIDYSITSYNALDADAKANLDRFDTHTYGGSKRAQIKQTAIDAGKNLWMSEVDGNWNAFGLAGRILTDLNDMQASAWILWDIVDFHKDSNFTDPSGNKTEANASINPDGSMWGMAMGNHDEENIELSMKYYGFGQFTRYIKPGMTLIDSSSNSLAAYDKKTGDIVVVAVNSTNTAAPTQIDLREFETTGSKAKVIRTSGSFSSGEKWAELADIAVEGKQFTTELKANSITTFVIEGERGGSVRLAEFTADNTGVSYKYETTSAADGYDVYLAVYKDGALKAVTKNESEKSIEGDFEGCTPKLMIWDGMKPVMDVITEVTELPSEPIRYMTIDGAARADIGEVCKYTAAVGPEAVDTPITWSVSDEAIATVTADGTLTAISGGTVTLTATAAEIGISTSIEVRVINPSDKYDGTDYKWVSSVSELTNDFKSDLKGFVVSGNASLGTDTAGEAVLKVMDAPANAVRAGDATITLENPVTCANGQIINFAVDMYFAHSNGTSTFVMSASDGTELVKIEGSNWGATYTVAIGGVSAESAGDCNTYFKNGHGDKTNDAYITNGGHVEVYYTPSTGEITVTVKNVTGTAAMKTYTGTAAAGKDIGKVQFASSYSSYSRPMLVDNLVTNILMGSELAGEVLVSGHARVGETLTAAVSGFDSSLAKYQWQANTGAEGAYVNIDGATASTYVITEDLVGKNVRCVVTAEGFDGELVSDATIAIIGADEALPVLTGTVTLDGKVSVGNTLTATAAVNEGAAAKYQWQVKPGIESAYVNIDGATTNTLELTDDFIGKSVKCVVTADNFDGSVESEPTAAVAKHALTGTIAVTGNANAGSTLTAEVAGLNDDAAAKYQWQANTGAEGAYENIASATTATLAVTDALIGYKLKCVVTADNFDGSLESAETAAVYRMDVKGNDVAVTGAQYTYAAYLDNAEEPSEAVWTVNEGAAATIENGVLTATAAGKVTVTATVDGKSASYEVEVIDAMQNITFVSKNSGLGLETKGQAIAADTLLVQWENRNLDTAAWKLADAGNGDFNIVNQNAGMLLGVDANAKPVITDKAEATDDNSKWQLIAHNGAYEIKNVGTGKSLNVSGQSKVNGGDVILYAFGGGTNELWTIVNAADELTHVDPENMDYSSKYAGSAYTFVKNIAAATNDFESSLNGFVLSGVATMGTDASGLNVLGVQPAFDNKDGGAQTGAAVLTLADNALTCEEGQIVNMSFDMYCSNSGGTAGFSLLGAEDAELVKMVVSGWDNFDMTIGTATTNEAGGAKTYLRNGVNDNKADQLMSNGGHFEIYFDPATGDVIITLKNNTATAEMKTYTGNIGAGATISKLAFNVDHTTWSKQVFVDNVITNIVKPVAATN